MAYSDFTLSDLEEKFSITNERKELYFPVTPIKPTQWLQKELTDSKEMPIKSEKARSEWIVVPILKELRNLNNKFFTIYSGDNLIGDKEKGLQGECDFILSKDTKSYDISVPIFHVVEAKRNDLEEGVRQCSAQLVGAKKYNDKKGIRLNKLFGCTTTGDVWQFIEFTDNKLYIDNNKYYLSEIDSLLLSMYHRLLQKFPLLNAKAATHTSRGFFVVYFLIYALPPLRNSYSLGTLFLRTTPTTKQIAIQTNATIKYCINT
ncbi:hypothetical protein SAMN05421780_108127 [Flexibacter flexilis DSM 6793]|uniref:Type I restriction enzyme R protein N terminus (HSDR_N) n=1 Tax=Flexibacter flexilis DSM 6793 TaxID=927664 RepID=A0A1I1L9L3_9BACT|nr:hypothetical protein SAMN05421780_108127 [Flexibacter flexilis DSM 6793]